jgi:uncharacterized protein (DUF1800 family)
MTRLHPSLQPFKPTEAQPYDWRLAAHLWNRAGFGGTAAEIERAVGQGPDAAVDALMDFPDAGADEQSETDVPDLSTIDGYPRNFRELQKLYAGKSPEEKREIRQKLQRDNAQAVQATVAWWMKRMAYGPYPLQEKLTLFWHGHFTTSAKDERSAWNMWRQNELHRRMGAGNFKKYVHLISRDPAMLDYLNNSQNKKAHPNENYARELMELFTLGIGNYTEDDIKQGARAFTGWAHDGDDYIFRKYDHDEGPKTIFGKTGNYNGDEFVDLIFEQPACAKYVARRLFEHFAYPNPEDAVVDSLAQVFKENKWELRPVVRTILTSKAFYSDRAVGVQIKSPVQLVVGTARQLGVEVPRLRGINGALGQMGQVPFFPPNVKGWPGGHLWINTSTLFVRYNTAVFLAGGATLPETKNVRGNFGKGFFRSGGGGEAVDFKPATPKEPADQLVDEWVARLIGRPIADDKRQVLVDAVVQGTPEKAETVKKLVQLIVSMPEYQLC